MAKKIKTQIKLNLKAGEATPAPPVGPALGQHGIPIMEFIKEYNAKTADKKGNIIPAVITVYEDRSFDFITKLPPVSDMIKKKIKLEKGSGVPNKEKVGKLTKAQIEEIAKEKMDDLNADTMEAAMNIVRGTARSMGVETEK
ncbi:50S ribosomal protein L11 [Candidatus Roizmanbacteria bacterium RIFCSPLOWO2_01_FULL_38_12]|uniref:Large ribosomal subunit protein uL11 n=1 Tax=Candidatus Roizmanbacteria bacterium RIFCSPLOWO2_01_FULL_38_12 TaxID=1802061 RepID=A0A1F7J0L1_9BACT|nr:MAG: 50S ribosomal protein L11 [Candidatus Roizmanbacteria bacterium RIFCSPHIGHO2_01_FULL_38_15]OGK49155.1 MAG: 50S ribosomal protein L11 [Candidatus Roizmanbacteria bacterium RIFCSPLOWO2_01_FULL_38_12]